MSDQTSTQPAPKSKRRRALTLALIALGAPLVAYLPGFVLALPVGLATSLPFWGEAKDYTCSSSRASSLIVRISPYADPSARPRAAEDWGCRRIDVLADADLGEGGAARPSADASYYVRIYTRSARPQISAPMMGAGAPIGQDAITIARPQSTSQTR